jgi:hypothetical protein
MTLLLLPILLTSELPDPGQQSFPGVCGTFGGFVGMAIGMGRRLTWERTTKLAAQVGAVAYGTGFAVWLVVVATDLL